MVSRSAAVKFREATIDNFRLPILLNHNYRVLIQNVFLVRQATPNPLICRGGGDGQWRETRRNGMAGSRARPPVGAGPLSEGSEPARREAAEYIASMLKSLRLVAHQAELPFLAYLIGVALEEADDVKSRSD